MDYDYDYAEFLWMEEVGQVFFFPFFFFPFYRSGENKSLNSSGGITFESR